MTRGLRVPAVAVLALAALAWAAGCVALVAAAPGLAAGAWYTPEALAAAHLVGLGFLTTAIAGALLHLAPNMSRAALPGGPLAGALLWAGAATMAVGFWRGWAAAEAAGGVVAAAGAALLVAGVARLWLRRRGSWPEPAAGLAVAGGWLAATLVLAVLALVERRTGGELGLDRPRLIGAHAATGGLGWIGGTILAMATRMAPMMLIAPVERVGVARAALVVWHVGAAAVTAGVLAGAGGLARAGAVALGLAAAAFGAYLADAARRRRRRPPAAVVHLAAGALALVAAAALVAALPAARSAPPAALLALAGFGGGVTAGHILIMVPTMCWVARFGGLRRGGEAPPPVAHLAPPALALAEGVAFAAGIALLSLGVLEGSAPLARAGAAALLASAAGVLAAILVALARPRPQAPPATRRLPVLSGPRGG